MNNQPDYFTATNKVYEILANVYPFRLETDIFKIISRHSNIVVHPYSKIAQKFNMSNQEFLDSVSSKYGFTIDPRTETYEIWYNGTMDTSVIRFTLAHELGHILLGHTEDNDVSRKEASCFARNLLCAIPIIDELEIQTISDIIYVFDVSEQMAEVSTNHFTSDRYYIKKDLYNYLRDKTAAYMYGYSLEELWGVSYA